MYDVAVIGAGVIGTAIARALMRYDIKVCLIEKDSDVACGATKANSGIIHAGYDAPYGTALSRFNVLGNPMYDQIAEDLDIPFERIGSLLLAFNQEEVGHLEKLLKNGEMAGVEGLKIVDRAFVLAKEPNVNSDVLMGLYAPTCGIIEPWEVAIAFAENAVDNGCDLYLNHQVEKIEKTSEGDAFHIYHVSGKCITAKSLVNAAGVFADRIYEMVLGGEKAPFSIVPKRGQYYLLDKTVGGYVKHVLFPCPSVHGKGTLVLPTMDGNLLVGPDAVPLDPTQKEDTATTNDSLAYVRNMADRLVRHLPIDQTITTFSGIRAESSTGDFEVGRSMVKGFYLACGIKSPGLTAAPAIADHLCQLIVNEMGIENSNPNHKPKRKPRMRFSHMSTLEKEKLIKKDPRYGNMVCRCEHITEGEIWDVIDRNVGARTVNGVKRRARPGAGRCQGGFCLPKVMAILAKAQGLDLKDVCLENDGSYLLTGQTKGGDDGSHL